MTEEIVVDGGNTKERKIIEKIAEQNDSAVLMTNQNLYTDAADFPNGILYKKWREINQQMISFVGGEILWSLSVHGQIIHYGENRPVHEILAYWYPSHQAFLNMRDAPARKENFAIRKDVIKYAIVHRCSGEEPPKRG